jgi:hypothetical protein
VLGAGPQTGSDQGWRLDTNTGRANDGDDAARHRATAGPCGTRVGGGRRRSGPNGGGPTDGGDDGAKGGSTRARQRRGELRRR